MRSNYTSPPWFHGSPKSESSGDDRRLSSVSFTSYLLSSYVIKNVKIKLNWLLFLDYVKVIQKSRKHEDKFISNTSRKNTISIWCFFFFVQKLLCIIRFFLPLSFFKPKLIFVVEFQEKMEILNHPALKITKLNETFLKSCSSHDVKQSLSACKILISTRIKKCRMMFYVYYKTPLSVTDPEWKPYPLTLSTRW